MAGTLSLIPELEDVIQRGSRARRCEILQHIAALYLTGAGRYDAASRNLMIDGLLKRFLEDLDALG